MNKKRIGGKQRSPSTITLLFLLFAVIMFVIEKIPLGVTSMIVCIGLTITDVLDVQTAFAGFTDSNVILFVAMFIVGGALFETGMANKIGGIVTRFAKTERMLIVAIMVIVGLMSGVLSNTGTAAVLIPVVIGIAAKSGYKRSSLAAALEKTGAGEMIAEKVIGALGSDPSPYILTLVVFLLCCVMTNFMSNTATTALMVPICLSIAQRIEADPRAVLMACVIGGSCAYATPIGMPANTMVVGVGGYRFMDFVKAGFPLIIIATVVSMIILPIAFPFFP